MTNFKPSTPFKQQLSLKEQGNLHKVLKIEYFKKKIRLKLL
ncbi:hypothetical protein FM115_04915 [Marinilactibacillus psychrotolerans 42ea]|uniref:Uncharacterized protein n=1 Tax=Marinilactibacillus psychrotolerans 42ea TaxID=1255609 RepID=A0A1R4JCX5_9LACT|nr:hypothetical protein FM115_04915 [Marinilactibacillus psychrotolerans 42ea]